MPLPNFSSKLSLHKKHWYLLGVLLLLLIVYQILSNIFDKPTIIKEIPYVRTIVVGDTVYDNTSTYPGEVRGRYESNLAFQVTGKIISRSINLGDSVTPGQELMRIDAKDIEQVLQADKAALFAAEAAFKLASDNAERYTLLYSSGAISKSVLDQYNTQRDAAEATLKQAQAQVITSNNRMGYTILASDQSGIVSSISGEVGQVAAAGNPVMTVIHTGQSEIQIYVPENQLNTISVGQPAQITFWALKNLTIQGTVREISPMSDAITRTYKVRVALEQMPADVKLGMTAKVHLLSDTDSGIILPLSAIYQTDTTPQVWVIKEKQAYPVAVTLGSYKGNSVEITSGLQQGDIVIIGGINKLTLGQEVRLEAGEPQ